MSYDRTERARLQTNAERVDALLSDGQWHTNAELIAVGGQAGVRRLFDLKKAGRLDYEKVKVHGGTWKYRKVAVLPPEQLSLMDKAVWG